ncbi:type IV secretory system conjugative DNA transfer family protein [uncultured Dokdonia sp.]|uniref:type IV secretory system conjugative DNA transfer family protein n=1 Tax=uncultured Dokdonia sp. TaxID=575653 RepID=UPI002630B096|nr:type IV secretory system conjugative DNA transfer family protein [uncultured Dokdonia sp.]
MKILIEGLIELLSSLFTGLEGLFDKDHSTDTEFGDASKLISKRNNGFIIDGKNSLDMTTSSKNCAVIAGSGKGKSQVHVLPLLLRQKIEYSAIVNDNSGELSQSIPHLLSIGVTALEMNLTRKRDVYINLLDGCKGNIAEVRKVTKSLMGFASKEQDFFSLSAEDCLSLFIEHVVESESIVHANLGNVYRLILAYQGEPKVIERYMAEKASERTWQKFLALSGNSEKTLKSITATALSVLSWLGDNPVLADLTSVTNISFIDFRKAPHVLFIQSPVSDADFYSPMISLILQSFYRFAFSSLPDPKTDLPIMNVLDEFSSLIPGLSNYSQIISNSRKFLIPQLIALQDESQLSSYKELKDNILQNCYVKCYHGASEKKAFELEKLLGNYTYTDKETKQKVKRSLMTASEIREMDGEILVIANGKKPLKVKAIPAYKQRRLIKNLNKELRENNEEQIADYSIQYIDLEPYRKISKENSNS